MNVHLSLNSIVRLTSQKSGERLPSSFTYESDKAYVFDSRLEIG